MIAETLTFHQRTGWTKTRPELLDADLVLYFGDRAVIQQSDCFNSLRALFPMAKIAGCSTGGQIAAGDVTDDVTVAVAMRFRETRVGLAHATLARVADSAAAGACIGSQLAAPDLKGVFILSDGLLVNGSQLINGIRSRTGAHVILTGGLAGDGNAFRETIVGADNVPQSGAIAAVGFYGDKISFGYGSAGGWDQFGPPRLITKSSGSTLYELDGRPALDLYVRYLDEEAKGLPGTGLLYPLLINDPFDPAHSVTRTMLSVDWDQRSVTFAGDVPEGWSAQLMRGYFDRLAKGAGEAARQAAASIPPQGSDAVAILVSCIGRRTMMGQHIIDEIEAAAQELEQSVKTCGFYSYGEISPHPASGRCELHNQTMTVTTIAEAV